MVDPQLIFQEPDKYIEYITSENPEGQFFDRKEVRNDEEKLLNKLRKDVTETISAFANARGGILVLGIDNSGEVKGLSHLNENEFNSLSQILERLQNHQARTKEWNHHGSKLLLIYVPESLYGICETYETNPKAWKREAANNLILTTQDRERLLLERNKKFEQIAVTDYDLSLINQGVLENFKKNYLADRGATYFDRDEDFLKSVGACKIENNILKFTNAGFLFFAANPRSYIPSAYVRFLKYESEEKDFANPGTAIFDRDFDGSLPELMQKVRLFINESPFFKRYSYRDPKGSGIIEEPEYPLNAIEESVVNAIIHRDYNIPQPILCIAYQDAFVVRSPGKLLQSSFIPTKFSLEHITLDPYPRNPKIVEWSRLMRDENGQRFVKALSEGTRTMRDSMKALNLPAPEYTTNGFTTVKLLNNYLEREARFRSQTLKESTEFTNLFTVEIQSNKEETLKDIRNSISSLFKDKLRNKGWFIDKDRASRIIAHIRGSNIDLQSKAEEYLRIFPAYSFQFYIIDEKLYLSIDYDVRVINIATLEQLFHLGIQDLSQKPCQVKIGGIWTHGIIEDATEHYARVVLPEFERTDDIPTSDIIPTISKNQIESALKKAQIKFDLNRIIKEYSLSLQANASKERAEKILSISKRISKDIFPISYNGFTCLLTPEPIRLFEGIEDNISYLPFHVFHSLKEPAVRFSDNQTEIKIADGLTRFGAYTFEDRQKDVELIPLCTRERANDMRKLIERLQQGSMSFKGVERTFGMRFRYSSIINVETAEDYLAECNRLLQQNPNWESNSNLDRLFLVYVPEEEYPVTDLNSPYYTVKEFLLEKGIPTQMIDTPTIADPNYKDLNLTLNIVAKVGGTPWVLPNALSEADVFIGLSYTQYKNENKLYRTMGYANVFNRYGRWRFYKGNAQAFDYEQKHIYFYDLVKSTLSSLDNLPESPIIHIHFSAKFSRTDRIQILKAAREVRAGAQVIFVWINTNHNIRMFDSRLEGNGSLPRGYFVTMSSYQFYLSTTGYNTLRKTLGTPVMLEVNLRTEPEKFEQSEPVKNVAQHIFSLTKLNWSSSQSVNGEPVTIHYARNIARLSYAFLMRKGEFKLNSVLEKTPWFI